MQINIEDKNRVIYLISSFFYDFTQFFYYFINFYIILFVLNKIKF
jgi:hypothetical protein